MTRLFLSYAHDDKDIVEKLYEQLLKAGFDPWMDTKKIFPGENWKLAISSAIKDSAFFLACLSKNSVSKRGVIQEELKEALEIWRKKLLDDIYLIPVKLEECEVPQSLSEFQWVNFFEATGFDNLKRAVEEGLKRSKAIPFSDNTKRADYKKFKLFKFFRYSVVTVTLLFGFYGIFLLNGNKKESPNLRKVQQNFGKGLDSDTIASPNQTKPKPASRQDTTNVIIDTPEPNREYYEVIVALPRALMGGNIFVDQLPADILDRNDNLVTIRVEEKTGYHQITVKKDGRVCTKTFSIHQDNIILLPCQ